MARDRANSAIICRRGLGVALAVGRRAAFALLGFFLGFRSVGIKRGKVLGVHLGLLLATTKLRDGHRNARPNRNWRWRDLDTDRTNFVPPIPKLAVVPSHWNTEKHSDPLFPD